MTLPGLALGWFWRTDLRNEELSAADEKNRAERFVQYAAMLGSDEVARLGGLHGLVHLGLEDERRQNLVRDVLCSFVRSRVGRDHYAEEHAYPNEDDVYAEPALPIVVAIEGLSKLGVVGADLRDVDLEQLRVEQLVLPGVDLRSAVLQSAELQGASLPGGQFDHARCYSLNLKNAELSGSSFVQTYLRGANLNGANLANANLSGANLAQADLRGANLDGAELEGADLDGALIYGATLTREQLRQTKGETRDATGLDRMKPA